MEALVVSKNNQVILKGSHGTSKKIADQIYSIKSFCPSSSGSIGQGAYFWGEEEYLREIAEAWAKYRLERKKYEGTEELSVLLVEISTIQDRILQFDKKLKKSVAREMKRHGQYCSKDNRKSKFIDMIIQKAEKKLAKEIQVLVGEIPLPPRKYFHESFPYTILGTATCYVVRDMGIIKIEDTYQVNSI